MSPACTAVVLSVLAVALIGHYPTQKALLAKGWLAIDPQPQIKRMGINGAVLFVVAIIALTTSDFPFGLVGILLFIEAAVCVAFARKLRNK